MRNWKDTRLLSLYALVGILTALFLGCATVPNDQRIDDIPMYGQPEIPRPEFAQKADEKFIKKAVRLFGSREEASDAWAEVAEDFFFKGNDHYAMRRNNQAWLLDPENYRPYWGFAQVMMVREKYDDAILYYEKAKELIDDEYQKPALLSDAGIAHSFKARSLVDNLEERTRYFDLATQHFQESANLDESYAIVWEAWANSLYHQEKYAEAWDKVKKARSAGRAVHPKFLERLGDKFPEPQ
ncbi:MAG: hypothetical protein R3261_01555 [Alphaproteobacteria bacterium]|nr:hypothetical protein [Alphaproteobacteria bacterium]